MACPCGSEKSFVNCCGRFINDNELPETPEELMRSRYTAYTLANIDYIQQTMTSPAADDFPADAALEWTKRVRWLGLEIIQTSINNDEGDVEFIAHFSDQNKKQVLHEISLFKRIDGRWFYLDGKEPRKHTPRKTEQIGRNEPCVCGSGKKYKKCCGV